MGCIIKTQKYIKTPHEIQGKESTIVGSNTSVSNWCGGGEAAHEIDRYEFEKKKKSCPERQSLEMPQSSQKFVFKNDLENVFRTSVQPVIIKQVRLFIDNT
jgi:hypothetical protein